MCRSPNRGQGLPGKRALAHCHKSGRADGSYEALVRVPQVQVRQLIDFLDLPWEDACLSSISARGQCRPPVRPSCVRPFILAR
jgi:hypothetical protein